MIYFASDYGCGAHTRVLNALVQTNGEATSGYGTDPYCDAARDLIRKLTNRNDAGVEFFTGGTQANKTVIAATLRPYQGVLCAETGHIACHETGAVEACGHKVLTLKAKHGKITAEQIEQAVVEHENDGSHEHIVQPGMVYLSQPTECGTMYSLEELTEIYRTCRSYRLPVYIDGARLAYAMAADPEMTFEALAKCCDALCIGGTKCGAMFGEAVVIFKSSIRNDFRYMMKQNGAMLAKGRMLGVQFVSLLSDGFYGKIGASAIEFSDRIRTVLKQSGFELVNENASNQIFTKISQTAYDFLSDRYQLEIWNRIDEDTLVVRICISWATTKEEIDQLENSLRAFAIR